MNFSKEMIDLVREIRRRVPSNIKPSIKLANPDIFDEIRDCYKVSNDSILKALTRELFSMAGPEVSLTQESKLSSGQFISKIYRGQTSLSPKPTEANTPVNVKPKRIYRGQVVA